MEVHRYVGLSTLVCEALLIFLFTGNYDISKMHYEGIGKGLMGMIFEPKQAAAA
jgi:hypothetical protein